MPTVAFVDGTLSLSLAADLAVPDRAAAVRTMQALVLGHRPDRVLVHLTPGPPTSAALSVLARLRRLCETLSLPLGLAAGPPPGARARGRTRAGAS
ncbi:hypothetical protein ACFVU3_13445 [Streptomyces sp. NPDC058052]|uniref:hypothetical protein n=1 Tax=Streptomyces sp. NPDC058052 TaxID=3346316 RepID=UPI0036E91F10